LNDPAFPFLAAPLDRPFLRMLMLLSPTGIEEAAAAEQQDQDKDNHDGLRRHSSILGPADDAWNGVFTPCAHKRLAEQGAASRS
jgi:hypothetical protein